MTCVALGLVACAVREAPVVTPAIASADVKVMPAVPAEDASREAVPEEPQDEVDYLLSRPTAADLAARKAEVEARKAEVAREAAEEIKGPLEVRLASVRLIQDCPDFGEIALRSIDRNARISGCMQSTVQLFVRGAVSGPGVFRVEAVRMLDARSKQLYGPAQLREPKAWNAAEQRYEVWDGRVGAARHISFDLSDPQVPRGTDEPDALVLEVVVSIDGRRWTLRAGSVFREDPDQMIT